ncbi:glucose-6-phosphate dehydrogenase [Thermocrinis minervae]|uniref:Glucose-6-phosphate 1-dehydrogenase n=1 Tax=Thermocrinis minervae TaxID=381751 RepID=A0A1M6T0Y4_9AQUI|nr:glucose-6-phosphate dehydrogenase [Thermocrinis minervae]SHK50611.1 glucose-6-phosphate 1-dehydrogenase [Thermocrinis minervae]
MLWAFFVIGGTGDLARNKLLPALEKLYTSGLFRNLSGVYALARTKTTQWEEKLNSFRPEFRALCKYVPFDVKDPNSYKELGRILQEHKGQGLIFYLALSPELFEDTIRGLGVLLRNFENPRRIVVEKPFGKDYASAVRLNELLRRYFVEEEVFRIDHFLGKHTIQNIFSLRFSNSIFEGVWNKNFVDHVQVLALEDKGVEGREAFYETTGAVRDMLQNHMLQMLSFVAMEPPCCMEPESIRDEKVKVLRSIRQIDPREVVFGRYEGYKGKAETFVALKLYIDNLRWQGVPFYLMTGKALARKLTRITVVFKEIPKSFISLLDCEPRQNRIVFEVAPENKIVLYLELRPLADRFIVCPVERQIVFDTEVENKEPYESLLVDLFRGDQTLFMRYDEVETMWKVVEPLLDFPKDPITYPVGSWCPKEAWDLLKKDGREWFV